MADLVGIAGCLSATMFDIEFLCCDKPQLKSQVAYVYHANSGCFKSRVLDRIQGLLTVTGVLVSKLKPPAALTKVMAPSLLGDEAYIIDLRDFGRSIATNKGLLICLQWLLENSQQDVVILMPVSHHAAEFGEWKQFVS